MIKEGDVVKLKSGSPAMTVKFKTTMDLWCCSWFAKEELKEASFADEQLVVERIESK
ncbi:DUF2158 domain-containing protein [Flavobacterium subsaxonicum]|uniref:DUF2158 domain-containing protein n=1 Tax=Flavobacterium subsaxonicum TaxID=426226 RepID=UPI00040FC2F8|nr:DUF2158 domain-containing protein [Flavobacterium subsaxonicum]